MSLLRVVPATVFMLSMCLGAFAQDLDFEEADEIEATDSAVVADFAASGAPSFFHRVQVGFTGTMVEFTKFRNSPDYNNYFLKGVSVGWQGDFHLGDFSFFRLLKKKLPFYLGIGATLTYHTGSSKGDSIYEYHASRFGVDDNNQSILLPGGEGEKIIRNYRVHAFSITIPVSVSCQVRNLLGIDGLTIAPSVGLYMRFNVMAKRTEMAETTYFGQSDDGLGQPIGHASTKVTKSLMSDEKNGGWWKHKPHVGKLLQCGAQAGFNIFYKHYSFGATYMRDLMPFASHHSSPHLTQKSTDQGGKLPFIGTNCDEKTSTANNFAITFGYVF